MKTFLLLAAVGAASAARAQTAKRPEFRFYIGLQASYTHYPGLNFGYVSGFPSLKAIYPALATVGYRPNANYTLEASYTGLFPAVQRASSGTETTEYERSAYAVSLLVRRCLPLARATPWTLEATVGFVSLHASQQLRTYYYSGTSMDLASSSQSNIDDFQFAFGVGTRYRLGRHWHLTADAQGQLSVIGAAINAVLDTHFSPIGGGLALGTQYSF